MELARDIVIIVTGVVVTSVAVLVFIISISAYVKVNRILNSARTTTAKIEALATITSDQIGKPLVKAAGLIQGIAYGLRALSKINRKGE